MCGQECVDKVEEAGGGREEEEEAKEAAAAGYRIKNKNPTQSCGEICVYMYIYIYIDLSGRKGEYNQETTQMFKSKQSLQEPSTDWNM